MPEGMYGLRREGVIWRSDYALEEVHEEGLHVVGNIRSIWRSGYTEERVYGGAAKH